MNKKRIFFAISAIFVAVAVYFAIDVMTNSTPPWKRNKETKVVSDSLSFQDSLRQIVFDDTTIYVYRVRKGDILGKIAERFNYPADSIRGLNSLATNKQLIENQRIKIRVRAIHKVKKGEMIDFIAQWYGVSARNILSANRISKPEQLQADRVIAIPMPAQK